MSAGARWPLRQALVQARALVDLLAPHCLRIEVAGSIRRQQPEVGDIEIVLLPRTVERVVPGQGGLFDEGPRTELVSCAWEELDRLTAAGRLPAPSKGGGKYRCYPATETTLQVDVFQVLDPRAWGPILAIRTGPADWSRLAAGVLLRKRGLYLEGGLVHGTGWRGGDPKVVPCLEEADFLRACGLPWTAPRDRR